MQSCKDLRSGARLVILCFVLGSALVSRRPQLEPYLDCLWMQASLLVVHHHFRGTDTSPPLKGAIYYTFNPLSSLLNTPIGLHQSMGIRLNIRAPGPRQASCVCDSISGVS